MYGHALAHEPLSQGLWNLQFWWPFLGHHYYSLSMHPKIISPWVGGHEIYNSCLFTLQMLQNKCKDWPSTGCSWEDVNNDGFQPIAIGHPSDSDDLIKVKTLYLPSCTKLNSCIHYFWKIYFLFVWGYLYKNGVKKLPRSFIAFSLPFSILSLWSSAYTCIYYILVTRNKICQ